MKPGLCITEVGLFMYRMYGMSQRARDGGVAMYRMYGQIFAPAISALPPSMVVVCHKEPGMAV
jgi:hypothetical protein